MFKILAMLLAMTANPNCDVNNKEFLLWGQASVGKVESDPVPQGKVWVVRGAGVFGTNPNPSAEYMMEIIRPVRSQGNVCCWRIPVARSQGPISGTPFLALGREIVMHEGERISGRVNGLSSGHKIGITLVYYEVDKVCFPRQDIL